MKHGFNALDVFENTLVRKLPQQDEATSVSDQKAGVSEGDLEWICLRTNQKREHVATSHLRLIQGVEVFCPKIRYQKLTKRGKVWFNEALFPSYLFAKLNLELHQTWATSSPGISGAVKFGEKPYVVPDWAIEELRSHIPESENVVIEESLEPGATVIVANPLFFGIRAVVTRVMPARERISVLLDFLGRVSEVEISTSEVLGQKKHILTK